MTATNDKKLRASRLTRARNTKTQHLSIVIEDQLQGVKLWMNAAQIPICGKVLYARGSIFKALHQTMKYRKRTVVHEGLSTVQNNAKQLSVYCAAPGPANEQWGFTNKSWHLH